MLQRPAFEKAWQDYQAKHKSSDKVYTPRQRHEWHVQAAVDCMSVWAWRGAIHHLDIVLKTRTESGLLYWMRAVAWEKFGDSARALADFTRAVTLEPGCRRIWEDRAWLHLRMKQYPEATADFEQVLDIGTASHRNWHHLALLYLEAGKTQKHRAICAKMLDNLKPKGSFNPEDVLATCVLHANGADSDQLLALLPKKLEYPSTRKSAAIAHFRAGKNDEAADHLEQFLKEGTGNNPFPAGNDRVFAALIFHQGGRKELAETWHVRAEAWRDQEGKSAEWSERAEVDILFRELEMIREMQ